jgi:4-hydroxybutyrate CoA-transferase
LAGRGEFRLRPVCDTHDLVAIAAIEDFTAINSVIEVDLTGQGNAEAVGGRLVSATGGLVDFARGAMASRGGRSILALPATAGGGRVSRIVPRLSPGVPVALPRADADMVVTEHGVAHLRGLSLNDRAAALIAIAAPQVRDQLRDHWREAQQQF